MGECLSPNPDATRVAGDRPSTARRPRRHLNPLGQILRSTAANYVASESLTRGAAIAFYSVTSLIPVLVIVIAIAGLAFGQTAARGAIVRQLAALAGPETANLIEAAIEREQALRGNL